MASGPEKLDAEQGHNSNESIPACQSCRRKKAKCDRKQPCSQCVRFNVSCLYENGRLKSGLRAGAVEHLQRRMDALENMFVGQGLLWQRMWQVISGTRDSDVRSNEDAEENSLTKLGDCWKDDLLQLADRSREKASSDGINLTPDIPTKKRRRLDSQGTRYPQTRSLSQSVDDDDLPSAMVIHELVDFYFANVHHWIPVLHVQRFRQQLKSPDGRSSAINILYAIVAACLRFSTNPEAGTHESKVQMAAQCRQKVILNNWKWPRSFCMVNHWIYDTTVEQFQLSVEDSREDRDRKEGEIFIQRMVFLEPSKHWWQTEERRRVFWTVFLMDRFCSISTGCNLSLTSADVKRRLPCEGALWEKELEVRAPFFGISDKVSFGPKKSGIDVEKPPDEEPPEEDVIGGFAYCIEATESLMLVSNFFIQHALDLRDSQSAQLWLMRFKELDLRIMQWKLYLPEKWRDASVLNDDGIMDPNLTLAHITHNTAVILLHQSIAYPPPHWKSSSVRLPSAVSAETCIEAASEIAKIGHQFLHHSPILTNPQFSFCLFVAGRMLLAHSRWTQEPLPELFDTLISNLVEISRRWAAPDTSDVQNLASVFAKRLANARNRHNLSPTRANLDIRQTVYSPETAKDGRDETDDNEQNNLDYQRDHHGSLDSHQNFQPTSATEDDGRNPRVLTPSDSSPNSNSSIYNSLSLAFPPLPLSLEQSGAASALANQMLISVEQQENGTCLPDAVNANYRDWSNNGSDPYNGCIQTFGYPPHVPSLPLEVGERISRYCQPTLENNKQ